MLILIENVTFYIYLTRNIPMKFTYKTLMIVPLLIMLFSVIYFIYLSYSGLDLDIDLKGGTQMVIETPSPVDMKSIENILSEFTPNIRQASSLKGYTLIIELDSSVDTNAVKEKLKASGYDFDKYSEQSVGSTLGASFFKQAQIALLVAFIFMAAVVFIVFRMPLPSFYMVVVAVADILEALVFTQIFGVKLSLATFAALLLLIGYSVDSDILLTTRVLKTTEDTPKERIKNAMKTGLTMAGTTLAAVLVLYFATSSAVIQQIASVLLIGLVFDVVNTWMFNAPLIRWYAEKREK